ncbi:MAG: tetratricopeptide repeat protein [Bacteroidota bacterium]
MTFNKTIRIFLKSLTATVCCCWTLTALGNNHLIDSLHQKLNTTLSKQERSAILNELAWQYRRQDTDQALSYAKEALELAITSESKKDEGDSYARLGVNYKNKGEFVQANEAYLACLRIRILLKDHIGVVNINNNLGVLSELQGDLEQALKFYQEAETLIKQHDMPIQKMAAVYENKGVLFDKLGKVDSAQILFQLSKEGWESVGNEVATLRIHNHLGVIYYRKREWALALREFQHMWDIYRLLGDKEGEARSLQNIGSVYVDLENYALAIQYLLAADSMTSQLGDRYLLKDIYKNLSKTYEQTKNFEESLRYFQQHAALKDSILDETKTRQIAEYQTLYEVERKKKETLKLRTDLERNTFQRNSLIGSSLFLVILGLLLALNFRQQLKNNRLLAEAKDTENKQKILTLMNEQEINSMNAMLDGQQQERQRIAQELHDRLGSMLATIKLYFGTLEEWMQDVLEVKMQQYIQAQDLLDEACSEVRKISHNLHSGELQQFGLERVVRELADKISKSEQLTVTVTTHEVQRLEASTERHLYRIIHEMLSNAIRHSQAKNIEIQLIRHNGELTLTCEDDGIGFDPIPAEETAGMGLRSIRKTVEQRLAGEFRIDSHEGSGTFIGVDIPIQIEKH